MNEGARRRSGILPFFLLAVVVIAGAHARFDGLGARPMFGDELDHYYAARSTVEGRGPLLPSGSTYLRGREYTAMVAYLIPRVESPEVAARLPSALLGTAGLLALALVAWRLGGAWAALWSVLLLAVYPEAIVQSRQARFYTYQQLWAILALYAAWRSVRPTGAPLDEREAVGRTWLWAGVAGLSFALAMSVQLTTLSVVVAWGIILGIAAAWDLVRFGRPAWRRSAAVGLAVLGGGLAAVVGGIELAGGFTLSDRATYVASWAGGQPGQTLAYFWALEGSFPALLSLIPALFIVVALRRSLWLALFLALWFAIPLGLHSLVLPWKAERYVFAAIPALFIAAGIATASLLGALRGALAERFRQAGHPPDGEVARWTPPLGVAVVAGFLIVATPASRDAFEEDRARDFRWPVARTLIDELPAGDALPLGSSMGLPALFYLGRVDFVVGTDFLEGSLEPVEPGGGGEGRRAAAARRDWYSGAPVLTTPGAIAAHVGTGRSVLVAVDAGRWRFHNIDPDLRETLTNEATDLCAGRCGDLMLHLWTTPDPAPDDGASR